jgi:hypothetical protein
MEQWVTNTEPLSDRKLIKLWPNPVRDFLYCTVPDVCSELTLRITDLVGKEVYFEKLNETRLHINLTYLKPGIYVVRLISAEMQATRLFVKI